MNGQDGWIPKTGDRVQLVWPRAGKEIDGKTGTVLWRHRYFRDQFVVWLDTPAGEFWPIRRLATFPENLRRISEGTK